jgi:hypothetical protein
MDPISELSDFLGHANLSQSIEALPFHTDLRNIPTFGSEGPEFRISASDLELVFGLSTEGTNFIFSN